MDVKEKSIGTVGPVTMATAAGAALTTCVCWVLSINGVETPVEVQGAITTIIVFLAGWITKPVRKGKRSM